MTHRPFPTLIRPTPIDQSISPIENDLDVLELNTFGQDIYTNKRPLWHPPGARGFYGGAVIAQSLTAAQSTLDPEFTVHSMHCYFVLAGSSDDPVIYYVERVRDGRSFATRTVQAKQGGRCILTTTLSFVREGSGGRETVEHATLMPLDAQPPSKSSEVRDLGPFWGTHPYITSSRSKRPNGVTTRTWFKAKGKVSDKGGQQAHLSALAYVSDSGFIGTVSRSNDLSDRSKSLGDDGHESVTERKEVGMMVSLDHTIYFHTPRFRADEWILAERSSPWSGNGRGVVFQHMFGWDGTLLATCVQEGVVRLKQQVKSKL